MGWWGFYTQKLADIAWNILKFIVHDLSDSIVSDVLNTSVKSFATISSVKVICDHNEQKMMIDIVNSANKWNSLAIPMLESYTSNSIAVKKTQMQEVMLHSSIFHCLIMGSNISSNSKEWSRVHNVGSIRSRYSS